MEWELKYITKIEYENNVILFEDNCGAVICAKNKANEFQHYYNDENDYLKSIIDIGE